MTHLLTILFLLLAYCASGAGLGPYNPAQHSVNGFMPTQVPDLQLWLDASKLSWMTNGQSVEVWRDWSGKSNAATNGTGSKQPTISSINGRASLSFDGVDDWLAISSFKCQTYLTMFAVVKMQSATQKQMFFELGTTFTDPGFLFYGSDNAPWSITRSGATHSCAGIANWNSNTFIVASMSYNGIGEYKRNAQSLNNGGLSGTARANSIVTNTLNIFSRNSASLFANGYLSEVLLFTNKLEASYERQVERYLGTKYGIVVK